MDEVEAVDYLEHTGEFAGLPSRLAAILHRQGLHTRGQVAAWYRGAPPGGRVAYGIGPKSLATLAAWLGADAAEGDDDAG